MPKARKRHKPGPPKRFNKDTIPVRHADAERRAWRAAAKRAGKNFSEWVRVALNAAATAPGGGV